MKKKNYYLKQNIPMYHILVKMAAQTTATGESNLKELHR